MRNFLSSSLLVVAGLASVIGADNVPWSHPERRAQLEDLLGALEGPKGGNKGQKAADTVTVTKAAAAAASAAARNGTCGAEKTVTVEKTITIAASAAASPASAKNGTCGAEKTVTVEKTITLAATSGGGVGCTSGVQLSFVTTTVFESGPAPTVTVTPLPQMVTQEVTVTVSANNAAAPSSVAGISMPGAVGTGGSKTTAIVKTSDPAKPDVVSGAPAATSGINPPAGVAGTAPRGSSRTAAIVKSSNPAQGNFPSAVAAPGAVGSPGAMVAGQGTDCKCLCGVGSFDNAVAAAVIQGTTMTTMASPVNSATLSSAAIAKVTPTVSSASAASQTVSVSSALFAPSITIQITTASGSPPPDSSIIAETTAPIANSASDPAQTEASSSVASPDIASPVSSPTPTAAAAQESAPQASTLILTAPNPNAAAAVAKATPTEPFDINTFSLASNIVLGNLAAKATGVPRRRRF